MRDDFDGCQKRSCIFMECLYKEKEIHKNHRFLLIQRKLLFIGALLGIGSLHPLDGINDVNLSPFFYLLVPFMAIAYDMYILAEDFKVKRVGAFLLMNTSQICLDEIKWEALVKENREPLAEWGTILLTVLASLVAFILILNSLPTEFEYIYAYVALFFLVPLTIIYIYFYWRFKESNKRLFKSLAR